MQINFDCSHGLTDLHSGQNSITYAFKICAMSYMWNLKNNNKNKLLNTENRLVVAGGRGGGWAK